MDGQVQRGLLVRSLYKEHHPREDNPSAHEPFCTWSRMYAYRTPDGQPVALAHQYDRPDGSIGGSGRPDPKWLKVGEEAWGPG